MNPQCARCGKIVYPTEKVSCLDKVSEPSAAFLQARLAAGSPPGRGRAEAAGDEVGGGAGGCERWREEEMER